MDRRRRSARQGDCNRDWPYTVRVELPAGHTYDAPFEFGDLPAALEWAMQEVAPQTDDLGLDSD